MPKVSNQKLGFTFACILHPYSPLRLTGTVIKSTGSRYFVRDDNCYIVSCKIRGVFRLKNIDTTNPLAVGDLVDVELDENTGTGTIVHLHPRRNYIIRKSVNLSKQAHILAANIDRAFLVVTLVQPRTSEGFIDRFLATAEAYRIPVTLLFNKSDLFNESLQKQYEELKSIYEPLGYSCMLLSAYNPDDIKKLKEALVQGVNLFSGHSGTGKSSLLNAIDPSLGLRTGEISAYHQKGMHTTTFAEMFVLPGNIGIIDTPGIKEFGLSDFQPAETGHFFPEMRALLNKCRFHNCLHINEPGCAVKTAVEEGRIHPSRYHSYLGMVAEFVK